MNTLDFEVDGLRITMVEQDGSVTKVMLGTHLLTVDQFDELVDRVNHYIGHGIPEDDGGNT